MFSRTPTVALLRAHLRAHNLSVVGASLFSLLLAAILWTGLYMLSYWMLVFGRTVSHPDATELPANFLSGFAILAGTLLLIAWVDRKIFPNDRALDSRPAIEHLADIILLLPRLTLAVWENLTAWVSLSRHEFQSAAALLDRLRGSRQVAIQELPLEIPDEAMRWRILYGLQVAQLVDARRKGGVVWLYLSGLAPDVFRGPLDGAARQPSYVKVEGPQAPALQEGE